METPPLQVGPPPQTERTSEGETGPERLLRAPLLQVLYSIRSERMLMDRWSTTCFRWFVGLNMDDQV